MLMDSRKGTVMRPTAPRPWKHAEELVGITRSALKVGRSTTGENLEGVAKGSAGSPSWVGSMTARPTQHAIVPRITTGKM